MPILRDDAYATVVNPRKCLGFKLTRVSSLASNGCQVLFKSLLQGGGSFPKLLQGGAESVPLLDILSSILPEVGDDPRPQLPMAKLGMLGAGEPL